MGAQTRGIVEKRGSHGCTGQFSGGRINHTGWWTGLREQERRGAGDDPRFLACTEAWSRGRGKLGRRHPRPRHRWTHLPSAKPIIGEYLSSQKLTENPPKGKENVCYQAHWLRLFWKMQVLKKTGLKPEKNLLIFKLKNQRVTRYLIIAGFRVPLPGLTSSTPTCQQPPTQQRRASVLALK